jgi:hypothetical protein
MCRAYSTLWHRDGMLHGLEEIPQWASPNRLAEEPSGCVLSEQLSPVYAAQTALQGEPSPPAIQAALGASLQTIPCSQGTIIGRATLGRWVWSGSHLGLHTRAGRRRGLAAPRLASAASFLTIGDDRERGLGAQSASGLLSLCFRRRLQGPARLRSVDGPRRTPPRWIYRRPTRTATRTHSAPSRLRVSPPSSANSTSTRRVRRL